MNTAAFVPGLTILAASILQLDAHPAQADAACVPRLIHGEARFPERSQQRGQAGVVHLGVLVDEAGRARSIGLQQSSGYRLLDRAAVQAAEHWTFDVSSCRRADLPADQVIAVEYRKDAQ